MTRTAIEKHGLWPSPGAVLRRLGTGPALLVLLLAIGTSGLANPGSFTEDFTTTTYMDPDLTTSWWNTDAGELTLLPLPRLVGSADTPGSAQRVFVDGNYAYVADFDAFQVVDISDPANPIVVAERLTIGNPRDVFVSGNHAYVADEEGLAIIDISNPTSPVVLSVFETPGLAVQVHVSGHHAYIADWQSGLQVFDVSDPSSPTIVGSAAVADLAFGVHVAGDRAYVADGFAGIQIFSLSDPDNPVLLGTGDTPGNAWDVVVSGNLAYVADELSGLQVLDISDPTNATVVGALTSASVAFGVAADGDIACIADADNELHVIDVSDPANPTLLDTIVTQNLGWGVHISGNHAFVGAGGLDVIRLSGNVPPTLGGAHLSNLWSVAVSGDHAYVTSLDTGLEVVDISDPDNPVFVAVSDIPGPATGLEISGTHAYVTAESLWVVDISDPTNPTRVGATPAPAYDVFVSGNRAYVPTITGSYEWALRVIDVSDSENLSVLGQSAIVPSGIPYDIVAAGDHVYVAGGDLVVFDVSDPANPTQVANVVSGGTTIGGVSASGDHVYMTSSFGLEVVDVSDPANPAIVASLPTQLYVNALDLSGDAAYLTGPDATVMVADISDPLNPTMVESAGNYGGLRITVFGTHAYVSNSDGLQAVRIRGGGVGLGQSLDVDGADDAIVRARLDTVESDAAEWEISADGGGSWQSILPDGAWLALSAPGNDLRWRSTLVAFELVEAPPTVSSLAVEWLNEFSLISSVVDVGNDQGRQVRVNWSRSGHDFVGDPAQITEYSLYRRIDGPSRQATPDQARDSAYFPPGWDFVLSVPADAEEAYSVIAPTLGDSTDAGGMHWSVFMVRARVSAGVFFDSPPDSGYSIDNLAPGVPQNLVFDEPDILVWDEASEEDFAYHGVYGSASWEFDSTAVLIDHTTDPTLDVSGAPWNFYHVTTFDHSGNRSEAASIEGNLVSAPTSDLVPTAFILRGARPNPFRGQTSIAFDLADASDVHLAIYDAGGRRVRLVLQEAYAAGRHQLAWDGRTDAGQPVAPGVYFARISAGTFEASSRLVVLR